ncbi:MAG TPA: DUF4386 domain-containing protein [Candidatus Paceibacterota bacterium]|nr:DUF4386 domain-containing protein [Candidatus Paceibacterota bacterium]
MKKLIGLLFVAGAVAVNIPYALLISNFNYPDILREPAGTVLTQFAAGGDTLIYTWLFFALSGLPLLFATILLGRLWNDASKALVGLATTFGVIALTAQLIGLLRWVFVVPMLAREYAAAGSSDALKEASVVAFQTVNQFGGVLLGEYVGQLFSIISMLLFSIVIFRERLLSRAVAWLGFAASAVYLLAQGELFHTVVPAFPVLDIAGLLGSMLWILWLIALGAFLILRKDRS